MKLNLLLFTFLYSAVAFGMGGSSGPSGSTLSDSYRFSLQGEDRLLQAAARSYLYDETGTSGIRAVARQADNKIVAVGFAYVKARNKRTFAIARYLENGQKDESFGVKGSVLPNVNPNIGDDIATSVVIQPDGGIVVGGYTTINAGSKMRVMAVIRLKPNGEMDPTFNSSGLHRLPCPREFERCTLTALALQEDGKILATGFRLNMAKYSSGLFVVRFNPNGTKDATFGSNGQFVEEGMEYKTWQESFNCRQVERCERGIRFGPRDCYMTTICDSRWVNNAASVYVNLAYSLLVLPNGNIVIGGGRFYQNEHRFYLLQITSQGQRITNPTQDSFDYVQHNHGQFMVPFFVSLRLSKEGKILALGTILSTVPGESGFALFRFNPNGSLDTTFGPQKAGYLVVPVGDDGGFAFGLVEQIDGKIIVAGHAQNQDAYNLGAFRATAEGELDPTFGREATGIVTRALPVKEALGVAALCHSHGKFVIAGQEIDAQRNTQFLLARFWGDECKN